MPLNAEGQSYAGPNDIHVMPQLEDHDCTDNCWCMPEIEYVADNGNIVWLHHRIQ